MLAARECVAAFQAGYRALLHDDRPLLRVEWLHRADAPSFESPFIAALCASVLKGTPGAKSRLAYLRRTMEAPACWRFSQQERFLLPLDADDTACALAALWTAGAQQIDYRAGLDYILKFTDAQGRCLSWMYDKSSSDPATRESARTVLLNDVDVVVNVNVLYLGALMDRHLHAVRRYVMSQLDRYGLDCVRNSCYYLSPFVLAYFLSRWLNVPHHDTELLNLQSRVRSECEARIFEAECNALEAACAVNCLQRNSEKTDRLIQVILSQQGENGFWPGFPMFQAIGDRTYSSPQFTTALCVEALRRLSPRHDIDL